MTCRRRHSSVATLAITAALGLGAAACGDEENEPAAGGGGKSAEQRGPSQPQAPGAPAEASTELVGGSTVLQLDRTVRRIFDAAGVEVTPVGAAEATENGIRFPINAGAVDIDTLSGRVQHEGGLRFSAGGRAVEATDFVVRPGDGVLTAAVAGERVPLFSLDFGRPQVPQTGDTVVLPATTTTLAGDAAQPLNDRLGVELFKDGLALGDLTITAKRP